MDVPSLKKTNENQRQRTNSNYLQQIENQNRQCEYNASTSHMGNEEQMVLQTAKEVSAHVVQK